MVNPALLMAFQGTTVANLSFQISGLELKMTGLVEKKSLEIYLRALPKLVIIDSSLITP